MPTPSSGFRILIAGLSVAILCLAASPVEAASPSETPGIYQGFSETGDIRRFKDEHLFFDVSFMVFDNAATADIQFFERNGTYYSVLKAETKGVVGVLTSHRKHFYKSTFDISPDGQRVLTRKFEREVAIGDKKERTLHFLDYENRNHLWFKYENGKLIEQQVDPIPEGKYFDDILAAFYNFRNSAYGKLAKGNRYKIDTIPDQGMTDISVHILDEKEQEEIREDQDRPKSDEYLLNVVIPKEVFKTDTGELLFWGSRHFIPLETRVLDYVLLGDLHVKFKERKTR